MSLVRGMFENFALLSTSLSIYHLNSSLSVLFYFSLPFEVLASSVYVVRSPLTSISISVKDLN